MMYASKRFLSGILIAALVIGTIMTDWATNPREVQAADIFYDKFDTEIPSSWTISNTSFVTWDSLQKAMKFYDDSSTVSYTASKNFTAQSEPFYFRFQIQDMQNSSLFRAYLRDSNSKVAVDLSIKDNMLNHVTGTNTQNPIVAFKSGMWHAVSVYVRSADKKYDVYLNGVLQKSDCDFRDTSVTSISRVMFASATANSTPTTTYIDNVYIYTVPAPGGTWYSSLYPINWEPGFKDSQGRFVQDFSYAGYRRGEIPIPANPPGNTYTVTDSPYNADNTGVNDATNAIQAAIDDAGNAGGGIVYLPSGTYKVKPQGTNVQALHITGNNVVLRGAGPDQTFIYNDETLMRTKNVITAGFRENYLMSENFESMTVDAAPSGWNVSAPTNTSATVVEETGNKIVKLYDNSTTNFTSIDKSFSDKIGVTFQFRFKVDQLGKWQRFQLRNGSTIAIDLVSYPDGLGYVDSSGTTVNLATIQTNTWYTVTVIANANTGLYRVQLDGVLVQKDIPFRNSVPKLNSVRFASGGTPTGTAYLDDVTVYYTSTWITPDETNTVSIAADLAEIDSEIKVSSTTGYNAGDWIVIRTDATTDFIADHLMSDYWTDTDLPGVAFYRKILEVNHQTKSIFIDVPLRYWMKVRDNARVYKVDPHLQEIGIENLSIGMRQNDTPGWADGDYNVPGTGGYEVHASAAILFYYLADSWIKNVHSYKPQANTANVEVLSAGAKVYNSRNITVTDSYMANPQYLGAGGNGYNFHFANAQESLFINSVAVNGRHNIDIMQMQASGNVITNSSTRGGRIPSDTHQHLTQANLFDHMDVEANQIELVWRDAGSPKHGPTTTQTVVWNTTGISYMPINFSYTNPNTAIVHSDQFGWGYVIGTQGPAPAVNTDGKYPSLSAPADFVEGAGTSASLYPQSLYQDQSAKRINQGAPPVPPNTSAAANGQQVTVSWEAATRAKYYKVRYGIESNNYTTITGPLGEISYTTGNLSSGTYYLRVSGYNEFGEGVRSDEMVVTIP
jgi:hypothetical protein